jgi:hypothetical protein
VASIIILAAGACGAENGSGSAEEEVPPDVSTETSLRSGTDRSALLCDRIDDDEALTPPGTEPLDLPDLASLNGERRCLFVIAADTSIEEVREFYRSALSDRGYEIADWVDAEGIVKGNLARSFVRATKPDLHVNLTIDEFDSQATPLSEHRIQVKLQFDHVGS